MKIKKFLAAFLAVVMCLSLVVTAFAVNGDEESTQENVTVENPSAEESSSEAAPEEESSSEELPEEESSEVIPEEESSTEAIPEEESSKEDVSEEESTEAPDRDDVLALIISFLEKVDLKEIKDALNDINEALGLPRVETFTDIPAYADALYEKLDELGLGYADIINGIASSDLLDWLNKLIFGGGSSKPETTTVVSDEESSKQEGDGSTIPDTGVALGAAGAAVALMGGSGALALFLRKRDGEED